MLKRTCDVENLTDFSRYYSGAWINWNRNEKESYPCYVGGLDTTQTIALRPLSRKENGYFVELPFTTSWDELKEKAEFGVPSIGMMPDGPTISFCSYYTLRAPKKGFRSRDLSISDFNSWEIAKKYSKNSMDDRKDRVWFAFKPEYSTLEQAQEKLSKGEAVGIPININVGIYSLPKFKYPLLAYKRWTVGYLESPNLIHLKKQYADYEEYLANHTNAKVIVG